MSTLTAVPFDRESASRAQGAARMLMCARCGLQVLLCRQCDRGQRFCGQVCSAASRRESQRAAARRYQQTDGGRSAHAARSRRWRLARRPDRPGDSCVTHQGGFDEPAGLVAAPPVSTVHAPVPPSCRGWPDFQCVRCHSALAPWVRQGLSRRARLRPRRGASQTSTQPAAP